MYTDNQAENNDYEDECDEDEDFKEGKESEYYFSDFGVEKDPIVIGGEWVPQFEDPDWVYVYDENESSVTCPSCGDELRYHNGECCCINCDCAFTDDEIYDYAGPWFHRKKGSNIKPEI